MHRALVLLSLIALAAASGCTDPQAQKQAKCGAGVIGGAAIGGILGNQIGGGTGKSLATAAGAGLGAAAGTQLNACK